MRADQQRFWLVTSLVVALSGFFSIAGAADDLIDYAGKNPSRDELIDALTPAANIRTRGISPGTMGAGAAAPTAVVPRKVSFDQITFELNSDRISPKARALLDRLGDAMTSDQLSDVNFLIEGHTDASGSLPYNMRLSSKRADAVRRYLIESYSIEPSRLKTIGKGPTDLLDKANPESGKNRRVVFLPSEDRQ